MTVRLLALWLLAILTPVWGLSPVHRYFVLRHGQTDANQAGIIQGSSDFSRLTELGRQQAGVVGQAVARLKMDAVYVSPLARARETLSLIREEAVHLPEETVWNELRELDLHEWEGRDKVDLQTNDAAAWKAWEQGNSFELEVSGRKPLVDVWERAAEVWQRLGDNGNSPETTTTLLVCHGTLGQALLNTALGRDASYFRDIRVPNCGLVEIEWPVESPVAASWKWHHPEPSKRWVLSQWEEGSRQQQ